MLTAFKTLVRKVCKSLLIMYNDDYWYVDAFPVLDVKQLQTVKKILGTCIICCENISLCKLLW